MIVELNLKVLHEAFMKNVLRENDTNTRAKGFYGLTQYGKGLYIN